MAHEEMVILTRTFDFLVGQALSYLKVTGAGLAIVANFGAASLQDERLPNFLQDNQPEFSWQPKPVDPRLLHPELVNAIQQASHRVHHVLGTGFLHQVYRRATMIELRRSGLSYEYIVRVPVEYHGHLLGHQQARLILVEGKVLLTTFALREVTDAMTERLKGHLRCLHLKLGLLANFHGTVPTITPLRIR